jgi:hypothetical protein
VSAPCRTASLSRTQLLPTGPPRHHAPLVSCCARVARARRLPCSQRCPPPRPRDVCRTSLLEWPRAAAPVSCLPHVTSHPGPPSPLLLLPHAAPSRTPFPFPPRPPHRAAIKRCHPMPSLVSPVFLSPAPPPPLPSPRRPCPPTVIERRWTVLDFARTVPLPAFVSERRPELRSFATNRPLLIALLLQATGARHGCWRPPCQLHRRRTPLRSAAPPTHRYGGEPRLRSPCPAHPLLIRGALVQYLAAG